MRRLILLGVLFLSEFAAAQFTTVSGTVVDPNGLPYANGTISATLVTSASPTLNGFAYTPPTQPTGLDINGKFTLTLADNTVLLPAATKWNFTVCSAVGTVSPSIGTGSQCFSLAAPITISGASQSISTQLNAAATALTVPGVGGAVTSVSGSAPIASSGGATPVISCTTCTTGTLAANQIPFGSASNVLQGSNNFTFDGVSFRPIGLTTSAVLGLTTTLSLARFTGGAGTNPQITGLQGTAENTSTGNVTRLIGVLGNVRNTGAGTVAEADGFVAGNDVVTTGPITTYIGFHVTDQTFIGAGTAFGMVFDVPINAIEFGPTPFTGPTLSVANGSPAGAFAAPLGSIYMNLAGGAGTSFFVKESGGSTNAGWTALTNGATINATNNVIPKRSSATAFADSALTDSGTTLTSTDVSYWPDGTSAAPGYAFANCHACGLFRGGSNRLIMTSNGTTTTSQNGSDGLVILNGFGLALSTAADGTGVHPLFTNTAPTISSGFGTSPSITGSNGSGAFRINVGTGGTASAGVIGVSATSAVTGWNCTVSNLTAQAGNRADDTVQTASTATTVSVQNQTKSTGAALAWTASDILTLNCFAFN